MTSLPDPCPYCAKTFKRHGWRAHHVVICPQRPEVRRIPIGLQPCPHCGRSGFGSGAGLANHVRLCDKNPAAPAFGRARRAPAGAPCGFCGRNDFDSERSRWCHVGKCPQNPARQRSVTAAAAKPVEDGPCPHCQREDFRTPHSRTMHVMRCPDNPNRARVSAGRPKTKPESPKITTQTPCPFCNQVGWPSTHSRGQHVRACREKSFQAARQAPPAPAPAPAAPSVAPAPVEAPRSIRQREQARADRNRLPPGTFVCPRCGSSAFAECLSGGHCQKCEREQREAAEPGRWRKTAW